MPIRDVSEMNLALDLRYGANKGAIAPAEDELALFIGDPLVDGVEVADTTETEAGTVANGYARVTIPNDGTTWLPADQGEKVTAAPVAFPDALAEYPGTVTHWALFNKTTGDMGDCAPLVDPLDVTAAGDGPAVSLTVFYSNNLDEV